jgi:NADH:ubiquinone oxidoreductase subunit 5 (subunit L)/multisubunit Na+/H+ antiporter MnhA subunit
MPGQHDATTFAHTCPACSPRRRLPCRPDADYCASCRNWCSRFSACCSWSSTRCSIPTAATSRWAQSRSSAALTALASTFWMAQASRNRFLEHGSSGTFSVFFHVLVIAIAAVTILSSFEYLAVQRIRAGEYYGLILFGTVGMCLMSSAIELVLIFIALEISSISTYILAGFRRRDAASSESSLKYFLLGSFATAFFLYGVALMFGATGSTNIDAISRRCAPAMAPMCRFWPMLRPRSCLWAWASRLLPRPSMFGLLTFTKARRLRLSG